jgi:hypothetical protein
MIEVFVPSKVPLPVSFDETNSLKAYPETVEPLMILKIPFDVKGDPFANSVPLENYHSDLVRLFPRVGSCIMFLFPESVIVEVVSALLPKTSRYLSIPSPR